MLDKLLSIPIIRNSIAEGKLEVAELGTEGDWNANTISLILGIDIVGKSMNNFMLYSSLMKHGYIEKPTEDDICVGCTG